MMEPVFVSCGGGKEFLIKQETLCDEENFLSGDINHSIATTCDSESETVIKKEVCDSFQESTQETQNEDSGIFKTEEPVQFHPEESGVFIKQEIIEIEETIKVEPENYTIEPVNDETSTDKSPRFSWEHYGSIQASLQQKNEKSWWDGKNKSSIMGENDTRAKNCHSKTTQSHQHESQTCGELEPNRHIHKNYNEEHSYSIAKFEFKFGAPKKVHIPVQYVEKRGNSTVHICALCGYKTNLKPRMTDHIRTHTKEKPYACSKCKYKTAYSAHLTRHFEKKHTKDKPMKRKKNDIQTTNSSLIKKRK